MSSIEKKFIDVIKYHVDCQMKLSRYDQDKVIKEFDELKRTFHAYAQGVQNVHDEFVKLEQTLNQEKLQKLLRALDVLTYADKE